MINKDGFEETAEEARKICFLEKILKVLNQKKTMKKV